MKPRTDMKKYLIIMACALAIAGCKQKQGQTAGDTAAADNAGADTAQTAVTNDMKWYSTDMIASGWAALPIDVEGGGEQPDIVTLLRAFDSVWHNQTVSALLGIAVDRVDEHDRMDKVMQLNRDTGGGMEINYRNGYASVQPGDTDDDRLFATVWKRKNGHRLLGVWLYTPSDDNRSKPEHQVLCFYDYDPKTQVMTPEKENAITRFQPSKDCYLEVNLPASDRDVILGETNSKYESTWHVFAFDGMNFKEETAYTDVKMLQTIVGLWKSDDPKMPLTFRVMLDDEDWPQVRECAVTGNTEWQALASIQDGRFYVLEAQPVEYDEEGNEHDSGTESGLVCSFRLTKDGRLMGGCSMKLNNGKEFNGILTLRKQSQLNDYAE